MCITTYAELKQNDKIRIQLTLPAKKDINCLGKVAWVRKIEKERVSYDIGIEFVEIDEKDRNEIHTFTFVYFFDEAK